MTRQKRLSRSPGCCSLRWSATCRCCSLYLFAASSSFLAIASITVSFFVAILNAQLCMHTCVVLDQCWLFYTLRFFVCSFKYVLRHCVTSSDRCVMRGFCKPGVCAHALVCERNKNQTKYITTRTITVTVTQRPVQKIHLSFRRKKTIESSKSCWLTALCFIGTGLTLKF